MEEEKPKRKRSVKKPMPSAKEFIAEPKIQPTALSMVKDTVTKTLQEKRNFMEKLNIKRIAMLVGIAIVSIILLTQLSRVFSSVNSTEYKIKQAAVTGTMSCHAEPGWFLQMFGDVYQYDKTGTFYFSSSKLDGGSGEEADPLPATFQGNSTAKISGYLKYRLPSRCEDELLLHNENGNQESVRMNLIRNAISTALQMSGPLFTPEEANIDRRPEFTKMVREILESGEFQTETSVTSRIEDGDSSNVQYYKQTKMFLDKNGQRIITKPSVLKRYGIEVIALDIKGFEFDTKTQELMAAKKQAEQQRIAAKALAEKSKQDAITEREQGNARTAKAKADQEVIKITEVTQAEKQFEVAELAAKTALEDAKKVKAEGDAKAYAAAAAVRAGLTPLERATIEKDTKIGIAQALSNVQFPNQMIISGGGNGGGGANPFEAIGLNSLYQLSEKMAGDNVQSQPKATPAASKKK